MTAAAAPHFCPPRRFDNAAEWLRALGGVPLERIIFDPWPGTATEADLLRLVEGDKLCELIDGTLVEKPAGYWEALIAARLIARLTVYAEDHALGAVSGPDSTLRMRSCGRVRLPDVSFVATERLPKAREAIPTLAPDLAVEVLSESNTPAEIAQKLREYFDSGTRLAWVIDPVARNAAIYHAPGEPARRLSETDHLDGEQVLPGFTLPLSDLFRNAPPAQ